MREAMWGIFIILLGALGIAAVSLIQSLTITNDQTYFLMKEATKAAMADSVDITYYRTTAQVRIVKEKFAENLTRRIAQSSTLNQEYNIVIHDIVELPPKVSLSIVTNAKELDGKKHEIIHRIDSIYETIYETADTFTGIYGWDIINIIIPDPTPPVYSDGECPEANKQAHECIWGDLKWEGWSKADTIPNQQCPEDLAKLGALDRKANYKECDCGKWEDKTEIKTSSPIIVGNLATYTWNFKKIGPLNTIDQTQKYEVKSDICVVNLPLLKKDDLPGTHSGGVLCSPDGINIVKGQKATIYPRYIPINSVNRRLKWDWNNSVISLLQTNSVPNRPEKDNAFIQARYIETYTDVTATSTNGRKSDNCRVYVTTCKDVTLEMGDYGKVSFNREPILDYNDLTFSVANNSIASIDGFGSINPKKAGTTTYTVKASDGSPQSCNLTVTAKPITEVFCPDPKLEMMDNSNGVASIADKNGISFSGGVATSWSLSGTPSKVSINSQTGEITAEEGASYKSLNYVAYLASGYQHNGTNVIVCPFQIIAIQKKDIIPTPEPTPDIPDPVPPTPQPPFQDNNGCTVGNITASWEKKSLPKMCEEDITFKSRDLTNALGISATPTFCGYYGYRNNNCKNGDPTTMRKVFIPTNAVKQGRAPTEYGPGYSVAVSSRGSTYSVTWTLSFRYNGWNSTAFDCPLVNNTYTKSISETRTGTMVRGSGQKNYAGNDCSEAVPEITKNTISLADSSKIEVIVGSTGGISITALATFETTGGNDEQIKWKLEGSGTINKSKGKTIIYNPPRKSFSINTSNKTVKIIASHPINSNLQVQKTITLVPFVGCEGLRLGVGKICVDVTGETRIEYGTGSSYNKNAFWTLTNSGGQVERLSSDPSLLFRGKGITQGSYTLRAAPQVGDCPGTTDIARLTRSLTVGATNYSCTGEVSSDGYTLLNGKFCYMEPGTDPCGDYHRYVVSKNTCVRNQCPTGSTIKKDGLCYETATPSVKVCDDGYIICEHKTSYCCKWKAADVTLTEEAGEEVCTRETTTKHYQECPTGKACSKTTSSRICNGRNLDAPCFSLSTSKTTCVPGETNILTDYSCSSGYSKWSVNPEWCVIEKLKLNQKYCASGFTLVGDTTCVKDSGGKISSVILNSVTGCGTRNPYLQGKCRYWERALAKCR